MPIQKIKAVLVRTWGDLSYRSDFEPLKRDIAEENKGKMANFLSYCSVRRKPSQKKGFGCDSRVVQFT